MSVRARVFAGAFALMVVTGFASPAAAQKSQALKWCEASEADGVSLDLQISGCTTVIQSGKETKKDLAITFNNRGLAYDGKGQYDRAIEDYDQAIRLNPQFADAFFNRGNAYYGKGQYDRAIEDYTQAIRLNPQDAKAFKNRGRLHFYAGDFSAAAADWLCAVDLKDDAYTMLWRYLARGHLKQDAAAELSANAARLKTKDWPYAVIDFYLGRRTLDEMRAAAGNANDKCEAAFYAGEWQLLHGNRSEAKASLETAMQTCPKTFVEYSGAVAELKRLQ